MIPHDSRNYLHGSGITSRYDAFTEMMTTNQHNVNTAHFASGSDLSGYAGLCSCGWAGPFRPTTSSGPDASHALAWGDCKAHRHQANATPTTVAR